MKFLSLKFGHCVNERWSTQYIWARKWICTCQVRQELLLGHSCARAGTSSSYHHLLSACVELQKLQKTPPLSEVSKLYFFFFLNFRDKANNSPCALSEKLMKFTPSEVGEKSKQIILSFSLEYMECCHTEQTFLLSGTRHLTACADRSSPGIE